MYYLFLSLKTIYFLLLPQASQPSMNFNISELVYCLGTLTMAAVSLFWNTNMAAVTSCENALYLFAVKSAIYYVAIATVIFSRVKISCFRGKAHLTLNFSLKKLEGHWPIPPTLTESKQYWVGRGRGEMNR